MLRPTEPALPALPAARRLGASPRPRLPPGPPFLGRRAPLARSKVGARLPRAPRRPRTPGRVVAIPTNTAVPPAVRLMPLAVPRPPPRPLHQERRARRRRPVLPPVAAPPGPAAQRRPRVTPRRELPPARRPDVRALTGCAPIARPSPVRTRGPALRPRPVAAPQLHRGSRRTSGRRPSSIAATATPASSGVQAGAPPAT